MSQPSMRGRRGRDRRIAEQVAKLTGAGAIDGKVAIDADAGIDDGERGQPDASGRAGGPSPLPAARSGGGRRIPDLAALPPLLEGSGAFATLRERLGPAGEAPGQRGRHAGLTTVPHAAKSFLAAALALAAGERICWVARDAEIGDRVADELAAWLGDPAAVAVLEPRTALAFERSELVADETAARVAALAAWRSGRARILVAGVQALLQHTIDPAELPESPAILRVGDRRSQDGLLRDLFGLGYVPVTEVAGRGELARRGGIVDVFPPSRPLPVRIEFFGDEIDSLRAFDPTDQRTVGRIDAVELLPASEFLRPAGGTAALRTRLGRLAGRLPERMTADLARWAADGAAEERRPERPRPPSMAGARFDDPAPAPPTRAAPASAPASAVPAETRALDAGDAAEVWAPFLAPATAFDHLAPGTLLVLDEPADVAEAAAFLWQQATDRAAELVTLGDLPAGWPGAYPDEKAWRKRLAAARTLELTWESEPPAEAGVAAPGLWSGDLFGWHEPVLPFGRAERIGEAVHRWRSGVDAAIDGASEPTAAIDGVARRSTPPRIVIASDQAPRLAELLAEADVPVGPVSRIAEPPPPGAVVLVERSLNGGFGGGPDGLLVVTDRELFGSVRVRRPKALRRVVPRDLLEKLEPGDFVVHIDHGIARHVRMLRRGGAGEERDYVELEFAGGDRIFVPLEQIGRVSRYSGGERPQLSKLGGGEWQRTKARVQRAVTDLAEELLELYSAREAAAGHAFAGDTPWQGELEASFPYEETPDQIRSVLEVKADMERGQPMDRLVVGDVGYGKTEVALRAAFKAIQDGRQVAVLVPTTVLAAQHHATFGQRFAAFPIVVRLLSRFVSAAEQRRTVAGLSDGSVDLVIGTHRLLSRDVAFRDLGLVVVDEEQRFGVAAKERLKRLRREVDVLTLSATPIPRTLNLALAGVRDLSVIETPPEDRLPIQTRVAEASAGLVRDAILRELDRGGQVFYVHNRVETIEAQAEQLRRLLPGARIVVGHGQMAEGALERVMLTFASGEADVLVCTTIIESGLDIPNANTIVIDRADTLGLAQLYQLRGRVGRSSRRAYAYLLYRRRERMSDEARKRLQAIFNASELGAGFQIALADLEIRGAGNILGAQQSGHMAAVGFDLYSRLLAEAVEEQKARRDRRTPIYVPPPATIDLPVEANLPDDFVPDEAQKLELYRRLAAARTGGDLAAFRQEVIDRFGALPPPVVRLVEVAELRLAAEAVGVASISREDGQLVVRFGPGLTRAAAEARLRGGAGLPGVRSSEVSFGSNQVRVRLAAGAPAGRPWALAQAIVARLAEAGLGSGGSGGPGGSGGSGGSAGAGEETATPSMAGSAAPAAGR